MMCFFKQYTVDEMRIRDWSSDVCSSDLAACNCDEAPLATFGGTHDADVTNSRNTGSSLANPRFELADRVAGKPVHREDQGRHAIAYHRRGQPVRSQPALARQRDRKSVV